MKVKYGIGKGMLMITKRVSLAFEESRKGVLYGMRASVREELGVCMRQRRGSEEGLWRTMGRR